MKKLLSKIVLVASAIGLSVLAGCSTPTRGAPLKRLSHGDKIGLVVTAVPNPYQKHVGSYVGSNFARTYTAFDWQLGQGITETVSRELNAKGLKVVDLGALGMSAYDVQNLLVAHGEGSWRPGAGKTVLLDRFKNDMGLKAVMAIHESPTPLNLPNYPVFNSSGVYSTIRWPLDASFIAAAPLWWEVWMLDPEEELTSGSSRFPGYWNEPRKMTPGGWYHGIKVKDYENIAEDEFQQFRALILQSVREKAERLAGSIGPD